MKLFLWADIERLLLTYGGYLLAAIGGGICVLMGIVFQRIQTARNFQNYLSTYHRMERERVTRLNGELQARLDKQRRLIEPVTVGMRTFLSGAQKMVEKNEA